jgi:hypothetical protein
MRRLYDRWKIRSCMRRGSVLSGREDQIDVSHYSQDWFIRNSIKSFK